MAQIRLISVQRGAPVDALLLHIWPVILPALPQSPTKVATVSAEYKADEDEEEEVARGDDEQAESLESGVAGKLEALEGRDSGNGPLADRNPSGPTVATLNIPFTPTALVFK